MLLSEDSFKREKHSLIEVRREREIQWKNESIEGTVGGGKFALFFGCRHPDIDYIYK